MRTSIKCLISVPLMLMLHASLLAPRLAAQETSRVAYPSLLLSIVRDGQVTNANAVLVQRQARGTAVDLYFLTAARLFRTPEGEDLPYASAIKLTDGLATVTVEPANVSLPVGSILEIAVMRASVRQSAWRPAPLQFEDPSADGIFLVAGLDRHGMPASVPERVAHRSTTHVVGDRDVSMLGECVGAPALLGAAVFGVVTECEPMAPPVVSLLSAARHSIAPHVPGLGIQPPTLTPSLTSLHEIAGPLLTVACDAEKSGEIDVPFSLKPGQKPVSASASFLNRTSVRLAEVSVIELQDRMVKLRFTLAGQPPSPGGPAPRVGNPPYIPGGPCPTGQALVSVRVDVVSAAR